MPLWVKIIRHKTLHAGRDYLEEFRLHVFFDILLTSEFGCLIRPRMTKDPITHHFSAECGEMGSTRSHHSAAVSVNFKINRHETII